MKEVSETQTQIGTSGGSKETRGGGFSSSLGFILTAAGSAVGVGNIWRFPYLAARDGGGLFLVIYLLLVVSFGFTLLTSDIAFGRRTGKNALQAYASVRPRWGFLGRLTFLVPVLIMTYYTVIGGWVLKYFTIYIGGEAGAAAEAHYFTDFITAPIAPIVFMLVFLAMTAFIVYCGVEKGLERFSTWIMPGLLLMIVGIAIFSLSLKHRLPDGSVRTGLQGLAVYLIPDIRGLSLKRFLNILLDAMGQLFFSLSVSMGIMVTYGAYVPKSTDLNRSISRIELFDTSVALLAGMMIIPAVFVFSGLEGMNSGPSLMFISLPQVFQAMGAAGTVLGALFFLMVSFAALTSSISIMETIVANCMMLFGCSRRKMCSVVMLVSLLASVLICLGYNRLYFELPLPNGQTAQLLDLMDYISNSFLMPLISLLSCILIGWVLKPEWIAEEMCLEGRNFKRRALYSCMVRYVAPVIMAVLFLQSTGLLSIF